MGSDNTCRILTIYPLISIHAPRMGSDLPHVQVGRIYKVFQSTLPAWGATSCYDCTGSGADDFNPRSPHGERRRLKFTTIIKINFNPRSPHGERLMPILTLSLLGTFQSTLPAWGATRLRMNRSRAYFNFNPRSPHGERHPQSLDVWHLSQFQSTLPAWGATRRSELTGNHRGISIHAPRMGSDSSLLVCLRGMGDFNPRSPHGERLADRNTGKNKNIFQSTLPAWGATISNNISIAVKRFQSTLPAWGATIIF